MLIGYLVIGRETAVDTHRRPRGQSDGGEVKVRGWTGGSQQRRLLRVVIVRTPEPKSGAVHGGTVEALYTKHDVISLIAYTHEH